MGRNDYFVIAYRILAYLYECLKNGEKVSNHYLWEIADVNAIGRDYFDYILCNLKKDGYLEGVYLIKHVGGISDSVKLISPMITPKGIDFLQNHSAMAKAREFLKTLKETIPGL